MSASTTIAYRPAAAPSLDPEPILRRLARGNAILARRKRPMDDDANEGPSNTQSFTQIFTQAEIVAAISALHGAKTLPPSVPTPLASMLMRNDLVDYTIYGWTVTVAGFLLVAACEGGNRGTAFALAFGDVDARIEAIERAAERLATDRDDKQPWAKV